MQPPVAIGAALSLSPLRPGKALRGLSENRAERCTVCGLDYGFADAGDGPAVFVILIAGAFIVACALFVEVNYRPPYWLHAVLWLPLTLTLCLGMLPPFKATLFALQYRNQAGEGRLDE